MAKRNRIALDDRWREKIKIGVIFDRMNKALMGEIDMTSVQLRAGEIILSKLVPTVTTSTIDMNANVTLKTSPEMQKAAKEELKRISQKL